MPRGVLKGKPFGGRGSSLLDTRFSLPLTRLFSSTSEEAIATETPRGVVGRSSSKYSQRGVQSISKGSSPRARESRG